MEERFIVQRHRDEMKNSILHDIPVARQQSIQMPVGLAGIFGFRLF